MSRVSAVLVALVLAFAHLSLPATASASEVTETVVVTGLRDLARVEAVVEDVGGSVTAELGVVDGLVARVPTGGIHVLRRHPDVTALAVDRQLALLSTDAEATADGETPVDPVDETVAVATEGSVQDVIGATGTAADSLDGRGVDVALIDSGVAPVKGLSRLTHGPDLSAEAGVDGFEHLDGFGHGTHMAGIIAGSGVDGLQGVAPGSRVVSVKVADNQGQTHLVRVLLALDWVQSNARSGGLNIRVVNLSLGIRKEAPEVLELLDAAASSLWEDGIVVVAAAGNEGSGAGGMNHPAAASGTIAVAGSDTKGTASRDDDVVAGWSSRGEANRGPDLTAPGTAIPSLRVPGSVIDGHTTSPDANLLKGSGTSQAAAVVSGAAALLLQRHPDLGPDEVRNALAGTAQPLASAPVEAQGAGQLDIGRALEAVAGAGRKHPREEKWARDLWSDLRDGMSDLRDHGVSLPSYTPDELPDRRFGSGGWSGEEWHALDDPTPQWLEHALSSRTWSSRTWSSRTWSSRTWSSRTWSSRTWSSVEWTVGR